MPETMRIVYGGVYTCKINRVTAVIDEVGRVLNTKPFPATRGGFEDLETWLVDHGHVDAISVEGTEAHGLDLSKYLTEAGHRVVEVNRPNRKLRRRRGKSDTVDAGAAARAALDGEADGTPQTHDGIVESLRAIRVAFTSSRDTRTRITNQIDGLIVTAPTGLRAYLEHLNADQRAQTAARLRIGDDLQDVSKGTKTALRVPARQCINLTDDVDVLCSQLDQLTMGANHALRQSVGVGPAAASILLIAARDNPERLNSQAGFAALCGASPVEARSGKTVNHRLNRGGNRQANHVLWRIATVRLNCHQPTGQYADRRESPGMSRRAIVRCLNRYVAREIHQYLTNPKRSKPATIGAPGATPSD